MGSSSALGIMKITLFLTARFAGYSRSLKLLIFFANKVLDNIKLSAARRAFVGFSFFFFFKAALASSQAKQPLLGNFVFDREWILAVLKVTLF